MYCCRKCDCQDIYCPGRPRRVVETSQCVKSGDSTPSTTQRDELGQLAYWVLMILVSLVVWPIAAYLVLRA